MATGYQLRALFVSILKECNPSDAFGLWNEFCYYICDDLAIRLQNLGIEEPSEEQIYDYGLFLIEKL
ncbi:hypothetical protein JAAARDRAFT_85565, partial [Jaapia argillacea MUCL 33604]